jgi:hypothetical protein
MNNPTDEQLIAMTQQYSLTVDGSYICHEAYELINAQVKAGREWSKCQDCGNPYPLDKEGCTFNHCSKSCEESAIADIMRECW